MAARALPVTAALGALSATVALAFGQVFGETEAVLPLVAVAIAPHVIGMVLRAFRVAAPLRWVISTGGFVIGVLVVAGQGSVATIEDRLAGGWRIVEHRAVPIPATTGTLLLAAIVVWCAAELADDLAFSRDASVGALAPGAMVLIWIAALGTRGDEWQAVAAFGAAAVVFLALQHQSLLEARRTRLGPHRVLAAPGLVVVAAVAGIVAVTLGVTAATALPGGEHPLFETSGLGPDTASDQSYRTDVPPLLDIGDQLRQGEEREVFTVRAPRADYWRITALDQYRSAGGGQWTLTAEGNDAVGEGLDEARPRHPFDQGYRIGPLGERWMPAAYRPVRVSRADTLVVRASSTLVTDAASVTGLRYRVVSAQPALSPTSAQRQRAAARAPRGLDRYTALPADFPDDIRATSEQVTAGLTSAYERARALRDFFRGGSFTYDPNVQLGDDESALQRFLRERRGFCVQFASAYAAMARAIGIPARVAVGFTPGTRGSDGRYHVTNHDAHAWPEIWLSGLGWTHFFDPTPPSNATGGSDLPGEAPPTDAAPSTPSATATSPPTAAPSPQTPQPAPAPAPRTGGGATVDRSAAAHDTGGGAPWWLLVLLVLVGCVVAGFAGLVLWSARRRSRRRHAAVPSEAIEGAWREAIDELSARRLSWPASTTPLELAQRVPARVGPATEPPLRALADAYGAVRYGNIEPPAEAAARAWTEVDVLRRALDDSMTSVSRLRARLTPRRLLVPAAGAKPPQPDPAGWSVPRRPSTND